MTASPHTTNTLLFEASSYGVSLVFVLLWLRKHVTRPRRGVQSVLWALIQCFAFSCHVCSSRCLCWLHLSCRQAEVLCWIHGTNQSKVKEVTYSVLCVFAAIGLFHFFSLSVARLATCLENVSSPSCSWCASWESPTSCWCATTAATIRNTWRPSPTLRRLFSSSLRLNVNNGSSMSNTFIC